MPAVKGRSIMQEMIVKKTMENKLIAFIMFNAIFFVGLISGVIQGRSFEYNIMSGIFNMAMYSISSIVLVYNYDFHNLTSTRVLQYFMIYPFLLSVSLILYFFLINL